MKRWYWIAAAIAAAMLSGCGAAEYQNEAAAALETELAEEVQTIETGAVGTAAAEDDLLEGAKDQESKVLIAYFTRLDNTEAELEEILQGGGPYGPLGDTLESENLDAVASASIQLIDGDVQGSTEAIARMIQKRTGGELFSIQTMNSYPVDYDTLIDQGGDEKNERARPELSSHVEHMEDYDIVFLGFPSWWYDMPMPVYSFMEEYDFSGKTVIPFVTSASSGFSDAIDILETLLPGASIVEDGFQVRMGDVAAAEPEVISWLENLGF